MQKKKNPRIAVEVLIGHGYCTIIAESSVKLDESEVFKAVIRIAKTKVAIKFIQVPQDVHLANNQKEHLRCGDNGIFKGVPVTAQQADLTRFVKAMDKDYPFDGKFILADGRVVICQSNADTKKIQELFPKAIVNPLGDWTGGIDVDSGATNRKLGSDMGDSVTGGGLHGKDLSKADVSVNIYAFLKANKIHETVQISCAIGDDTIDGKPYSEIVDIARNYIEKIGGFEKFAEWGLIR